MGKLEFSKESSQELNAGNNRPNVSIVVRACEHPLLDIDFILPSPLTSLATNVPKTMIYVDNITEGSELCDYLIKLLRQRNPLLSAFQDVIRLYNAHMSIEYRRAAMNAFREGKIRILVCTEAAGMVRALFFSSIHTYDSHMYQGCDIADVKVVVQWKLPKTPSHFVQRAGRAARGPEHFGLAVLLVERSVFSELLPDSNVVNPLPTEAKTTKPPLKTRRGRKKKTVSKTKAPKGYANAHGLERGGSKANDAVPTSKQPFLDLECEDGGLRMLVQSTTCRRKVWMSAFGCAHLETGKCNSFLLAYYCTN